MSTTIDIGEIQAKLRDIIARLQPGDEIIIVDHQQRMAKLVREAGAIHQRPGPGVEAPGGGEGEIRGSFERG